MGRSKLAHWIFLFALVPTGFFYSCSTLQSPANSAVSVELVDKAPSSSRCTFLGIVSGTEIQGWASADEIVQGALEEAREAAAEKGATHAIALGSPQIIYNAEAKRREATVTLNAYKCKK